METRTTHEAKIFLLVLNNMRGSFEDCSIKAVSDTPEKLRTWLSDQLAPETWTDNSFEDIGNHIYHKFFKQGSELEWCNKPWQSLYDEPQDVSTRRSGDTGIYYEWVPVDQLDSIRSRFHFIN